jgi:hypothetical protein
MKPSSVEPSSEVETTEGKVRKIAASALLGLLSGALIVAYASIGRLIWIDEFLHFASLIAICAYPQAVNQSHSLQVALLNRPSSGKFVAPLRSALPRDNDGWVALANRNVGSGGPVSPVFKFFYQPQSRR